LVGSIQLAPPLPLSKLLVQGPSALPYHNSTYLSSTVLGKKDLTIVVYTCTGYTSTSSLCVFISVLINAPDKYLIALASYPSLAVTLVHGHCPFAKFCAAILAHRLLIRYR